MAQRVCFSLWYSSGENHDIVSASMMSRWNFVAVAANRVVVRFFAREGVRRKAWCIGAFSGGVGVCGRISAKGEVIVRAVGCGQDDNVEGP